MEREIFFRWRPTLPDPDDDFVLELAIACGATRPVTFNKRDFAPAAQFGIEVMSPGGGGIPGAALIMATIQTELPERLYQEARRLAQRENISVERLVSLAVAQAVGAWQTQSVIAERAARADRDEFLRVLDAAPDVPPAPGDELPAGRVRRHA